MVKPSPGGLRRLPGAAGPKTPYSAVAVAAAMMTMGPELAAWAGPLMPDVVAPSAYSSPVSPRGASAARAAHFHAHRTSCGARLRACHA
jgi:hypothetical protein